MSIPFRTCLLFIVMAFTRLSVFAQVEQYKFSHLDITNGLSDNQVNCVFKDDKGFIWFGTTSGLTKYDGYRSRIYRHSPVDRASLGENNVTNIYQGPQSKLWIVTHSGISIYNAETEKFSTDVATQLAAYHIPNCQLKLIRADDDGNYWFIAAGKGIYCYSSQGNFTRFYGESAKSKVTLHSNRISNITPGGKGFLWLIYDDGFLEKLDTRLQKIALQYNGFEVLSKVKLAYYNIARDNKENIWIFSGVGPIGTYKYDPLNNTLEHFSKDSPVNKLNSNIINSVVQADDNKIWMGTDHGGIDIIDLATHHITYVLSKEDDPKSLSGNCISLYKDNTGIIWAGTFKQGVNYYHTGVVQFPLYKHYVTDKNSLPFEDVDCFAEDQSGNLWIGTNGGGLIYYNRKNNTYSRSRHNPADQNSLSNDIVVNLFIDHDHKLWIATYFGGLDCYDGKTFTHYRHNEKNPASLTDDRVYSIAEDVKDNLWVGTFSGGLNIFDPKNNNFIHPKYGTDYTSDIYEDRQHNIWIGRDKGVDLLNGKTKIKTHFYNRPGNLNSLVANDVNTILQDSRGLIWFGTKEGISILNKKTGRFLTAADGFIFPSTNVTNLLEDNQGTLWASTNNGLANIKLTGAGDKYNFRIDNFNEFDGLQGRGFNMYAAVKLKSGDLIFGGAHGFNLFNPAALNTFKPKQSLVFTDFLLFNKSITVGDTVNGDVVLKKSVSVTQSIVLNHNQNVFSIEFSACDYFNPGKINYQYMLEGFDKSWITTSGNNRTATYTNLDGADYVFKVRTLNPDGTGRANMITMNITVLPPFWKTSLALLIYFILAIGILFYIRHRGIVQLNRKFELKQEKLETERNIAREREETERMHQLDLMKIKFFTNISHEFRTPLSLILSPIDHLIKNAGNADQHNHLVMIKRNGKRLLNLVNQLLDFRKMEYNELKLSLTKGDIIHFIKEVSGSFTDVAHQKQIQYIFESEVSSFITSFDQDKIERICFNLLANAFKFTAPGGHISVLINLLDAPCIDTETRMLEIKIIDTGIGISKENQAKIFERFFQDNMPNNLLNQGSGIGLSITKEFVKMHGGDINLESEPDFGSCFIISLPLTDQQESTESVVTVISPVNAALKFTDNAGTSLKKPTVLIIEDNHDLRFYLKENLKNSFHIIEAANGKEGWQKALSVHPKLIVSDISMPEMNGLELCKKIKGDNRTAQIPVILLTAIAGEDAQLAGLEMGADDYIIKPFNFEILLSKIHNLLKMQQVFIDTYQKQMIITSEEIIVESEDDKFLKNAFDYIEKSITNPNFSVEELSKQLNLSRVSLYKKLLALTGKTPVDCIRTIRLKRAVQLLEKSKLSIANIGYEVGFNNPAYFAKVFREEYGILPSEYLAKIRNKEKDEIMS